MLPPKKAAPNACVPGKCLGTPGYYTTNGHESTALMEWLDALVQIQTNAQSGQLS